MPALAVESRLLPSSVRSRLLLVFAVIFSSAMALAVVGWIGIRDTRDALRDFQSHVLPDVTRSLELSQRIAAIAAMAPYVAESTRPFQLQAEAQARSILVDVQQEARRHWLLAREKCLDELLDQALEQAFLAKGEERAQSLRKLLEQAEGLTRSPQFLRELIISGSKKGRSGAVAFEGVYCGGTAVHSGRMEGLSVMVDRITMVCVFTMPGWFLMRVRSFSRDCVFSVRIFRE